MTPRDCRAVLGRLTLVSLLFGLAAGATAAPQRGPRKPSAAPAAAGAALDRPAPVALQRPVEGPSVAEREPAPLGPRRDSIGNEPVAPRTVPESAEALAALVVDSITPSPSLPRPYGTQISWTVAVSGGVSPYQFAFYLYSYQTQGWTLVRPYSSSNVFTWTPVQADIGTYVIQVWVKNSGSSANFDAWRSTPAFSITNNAPNIISFGANATFPKLYGSAITWTVTTTGGIAPLQFFFARYSYQTQAWSIVQNYSTSNTFTWTPSVSEIGRYALQVWVLNAGSTAPYDAWRGTSAFDIVGPAPTISALTPTPMVPSPAGVALTWTATASGGIAPLQYQFWRYSYSTAIWTMAQDWSTNNTHVWIPGASEAGQYQIQVYVKNAISPNTYDAWRGAGFTISPPQPLTASVSMLPGAPRPVGSILTWQATTTGGLAPLQFAFYRYNYTLGSWSLVQDWSTTSAYSWTPAPSELGDYALQVWVRNAGSTALDTWSGFPRFTVTWATTDIVRFLEQATFGPTDAGIERVRQLGFPLWIDEQFLLAPTGYPAFTPMPDNPAQNCSGTCQRDNYSMYPLQWQFFQNALYGQDQLRQRVAWALHQLVVTSGLDLNLPSWYQPYLDITYRNAFGNYRQLLYEMTLNPGMGEYLNLNTSTRFSPNENYAREVMQLFSVGTDLLNPDGSPQKLADGTIIPVYDQFAVTEVARALTGWRFANPIASGITNYRDPMVTVLANHDIGSKTLLNGFTLPPGQTPLKDLNDVLDNLFNHPNAGPYISRHLIKYLVTSNPSGPYIQRIATVFNNNGSGVRGDLKAVVKAILLDPEARQPTPPDPNHGHLKEPVLLTTNLLRAFNVRSANGQTVSDGVLSTTLAPLGQDPLRPPTVFSYYPADYQAPGTSVRGPEFGVFQATTALRRANFVNTMVFSNIPASANAPVGTSIDLTLLATIAAANPDMLLKELDRVLLHDTMSAQMKTSLLAAVNAIPASNGLLRAQTALYLVATSSQYQVER